MNSKIILTFMSALLVGLLSMANPCQALDIDDLDSYLYPEPEKTISMDFTDATLENVLKIFSQQSGLNFVAAKSIASETVNLYMDNVPVEDALEQILSAHNLTYEINKSSKIFIVKPLQTSSKMLMTRVYPLKFATVPSSKLFSTFSADEEGDSEAEIDTSTGIIAAISSVLSDKGSVIEDTRTNSLIVSDIPNQFPLIESAITQLDVRIPQILIEAEILDISKTTAEDMGVKFGSTAFGQLNPASRTTSYPFNPDPLLVDRNFEGNPLFDKEYTPGIISFPALQMTVDFLRNQNDTKNIARPRILTLNNTTAEIKITTQEAIGIKQSTASAEGLGSSVEEAERVETGVSLKVTPQANIQTREITMAIEPKVTEATQGGTFGENQTTFRNPEERGVKSILRIQDGDTVVLGGLLRTENVNIKTSVPLIGDIPIIGAPFRHKDKDEDQRELIIFITPTILEENTLFNTRRSRPEKIVREQSIPNERSKAIEDDLSHVEKKYFNSYK